MKSITDLNDQLFAQLDRLSAPGLSREEIEIEQIRTQAIVAVADKIELIARLHPTLATRFT